MKGRLFLLCGAGGIAGLAVLWLAGLFFFIAAIERHVDPAPIETLEPTEAIVVLTGGSERLEAGLRLLREGKGRKLLISGVFHGVGLKKILGNAEVSEELRSCCIVLGHEADNTYGNAAETKAFMQAEGFHSLRLVTAHYHMPRSLLFFRRAMPDLTLVPYPVSPDVVDLKDWWRHAGTAGLLVSEYNKFLFGWLRLFFGV